ncbi:MAG: acyl-CoA dehydrogenase family protein [Desulfobacterales bacterium]
MNQPERDRSYQKYFTKEHEMLRKAVREFVKKEIVPYVDEWEEAGETPMELYQKAGELGYLGIGYPVEYGGVEGDIFHGFAVTEELCRCGSIGIPASIGTYAIALPPIVSHGTHEQKEKFVKPVLEGKRKAALAVTEPGGGSDVARLKTTAVKDGDYYVVNGSKTFITTGVQAGQITCAVRTGGEGAHGISLLVIEKGTPGFSVSKKLKKMGWWASDTAELFFDDCRVPVENRIGEENKGFYYQMENFQHERLGMAAETNMISEICLDECLKYVKEREAFGKHLSGFQVIRHKLADMATLLEASREFTYRVAARVNAGENIVKEVSMAKNFACMVSDKVTYDAVQVFGGYGYMREYTVERMFRDNRIMSIGGGTSEIMKEIISKMMLG